MRIANKILIADDDTEMLNTLTSLLEGEGYKVIRAENGLEAVERARKHLPALVMLDIHMPEMDGFQACKAIKANHVTKAIPVVMLTIDGSMSEIEESMGYGARTYITKPSSKEEILKVVKSIVS